MTTNTTPTEFQHSTEHGGHNPPPPAHKPKKRGLIWVIFLVIIVAVGGYAVWRASQPGLVVTPQQGRGGPGGPGGRGGGPGGRGGLGPLPVVVAKATLKAVPVYQNGLGNVTAYYTAIVRTRVKGLLM